MMVRFGGGRLENPFEELKELKLSRSVEDNIVEFELYSQCDRLLEQQFLVHSLVVYLLIFVLVCMPSSLVMLQTGSWILGPISKT